MEKSHIQRGKSKKGIIAILKAENGFYQRMKLEKFVVQINLPFMYRLRISDPVIGDRFDLDVYACGEFVCEKRTKTTATYKLNNLNQVRNPEVVK